MATSEAMSSQHDLQLCKGTLNPNIYTSWGQSSVPSP